MRELFELLQIKSEIFEPNQSQSSNNSEPERIPTPQPSDEQESSSYESQYDGRLVLIFNFKNVIIKVLVVPKISLWKKKFSMISRLEIISSAVSYVRKDTIFNEKI